MAGFEQLAEAQLASLQAEKAKQSRRLKSTILVRFI
jgi:hypothetical protein